jgi:hypothetical protein
LPKAQSSQAGRIEEDGHTRETSLIFWIISYAYSTGPNALPGAPSETRSGNPTHPPTGSIPGWYPAADCGASHALALLLATHAYNNPVKYTDPSGHCPLCLFVPIMIGYVNFEIGAALGVYPDYVGIARAEKAMNHRGSIEVTAGLAVQGQFSGNIDNMVGVWKGRSSGYGLAQTNPEQAAAMGLGPLNPHNPSNAVLVMTARIENAQAACTNCNAIDRFLIGALAQNGFSTGDGFNNYKNDDGSINWKKYFGNPPGDVQADAKVREAFISVPFTNLVVLKYIMDVRVLSQRGWNLPEGISEEDLDYIDDLVRGK